MSAMYQGSLADPEHGRRGGQVSTEGANGGEAWGGGVPPEKIFEFYTLKWRAFEHFWVLL